MFAPWLSNSHLRPIVFADRSSKLDPLPCDSWKEWWRWWQWRKELNPTRPPFVYFRPFSQYNEKYSTKCNYKSIDGVLGIQTPDHRMVFADVATKLGSKTLPNYTESKIKMFLSAKLSLWFRLLYRHLINCHPISYFRWHSHTSTHYLPTYLAHFPR